MLAFELANELLNRGWIREGVKASKLESVIEDILTAAKQMAIDDPKYTIERMDNDFYVVDSHKEPSRRIAKFYPWPRVVDGLQLAERVAHDLNVLGSRITVAALNDAHEKNQWIQDAKIGLKWALEKLPIECDCPLEVTYIERDTGAFIHDEERCITALRDHIEIALERLAIFGETRHE